MVSIVQRIASDSVEVNDNTIHRLGRTRVFNGIGTG